MRYYIAFYNGQQKVIQADSLYAAKLKAIDVLKIPKRRQNNFALALADTPMHPASL